MLYLDTSALVKRYVQEPHSDLVRRMISRESLVATSTITRAETAATFSKAIRTGSLTHSAARACHLAFRREWKDYIRIRVTETLVARADDLAWSLGLRGYDAVHLAAAVEWQERVGETVTLATFDRRLWESASDAGIDRFPERPESCF